MARAERDAAGFTVDRIILATGPDHARIVETDPLLSRLSRAGLVAPDPLGLGLHTAPGGEAIGADGTPRDGLYVAGPLARGTVGELMGVPEATGWGEHLARRALAQLSDRLPQPVAGAPRPFSGSRWRAGAGSIGARSARADDRAPRDMSA